jgi:hypothetical protein
MNLRRQYWFSLHFNLTSHDLLLATIATYKYTHKYLHNFIRFDIINNIKEKKGDIIMEIAIVFLLYMAWWSTQ